MESAEPARHALYSQLENVLGTEHAETLMTYLPGGRQDEVATKSDLSRVEDRLDGRFSSLEARFDRMEERFDQMEARFDRMEERFDRRFEQMDERLDRMQRFYVGTTVGSMTALTAIFSLVVKFL